MEIKIRREAPKDYERIAEILRLAFGRVNESLLVEKLRLNKTYLPELSLVAEVDLLVVGYVLFFPLEISNGEERYKTLMLAPLAVHPTYQNKGVGSKLTITGLSIARDLGFKSVLLVGHPTYYPRFGFERASKWGIKLEISVPDEAFMAIELALHALLESQGTVVLPQEFHDCT